VGPLFAFLLVVGMPRVAATAVCSGNSPIYQIDTDGDGLSDACDPCPLGSDGLNSPSRDPLCYLGGPAIPPEYQPSNGSGKDSWWTAGRCVPAMAFPVVDETASQEVLRGLVIAGTSADNAATVLAAARAGQGWPNSVPALCLVSFDYARPEMPISGLPLRAPVLATLYATWNGLDLIR
jgi:hypothetical protein